MTLNSILLSICILIIISLNDSYHLYKKHNNYRLSLYNNNINNNNNDNNNYYYNYYYYCYYYYHYYY